MFVHDERTHTFQYFAAGKTQRVYLCTQRGTVNCNGEHGVGTYGRICV
jgi:hypothetical protein